MIEHCLSVQGILDSNPIRDLGVFSSSSLTNFIFIRKVLKNVIKCVIKQYGIYFAEIEKVTEESVVADIMVQIIFSVVSEDILRTSGIYYRFRYIFEPTFDDASSDVPDEICKITAIHFGTMLPDLKDH